MIFILLFCHQTSKKCIQIPLHRTNLIKTNTSRQSKLKMRSNFIWQFIPISIQVAEASKLVLSRGRSLILHDLPLKHAQLPSAPCPALLITVLGLPAHEGHMKGST